MRLFNKVTIIGVGLIGGSIGLAIKKKGLAKEVTGVFRRPSTLRRALRHKAIDNGTLRVEEGVKGADLIILATPVYSIPLVGREAIRYADAGAIITDAGSTKIWVVARMETLAASARSIFFVGSHPMAGSENAGVEFATADLFKSSPCIVTRTARTDEAALKKVAAFWEALGARVKVMSPGAHDKSISLVSHLPHLVAFSLAGAIPEKDIVYAAEGFRDTTRVASSNPKLWADIFLTNKKEIINAGRMFEKYYADIVRALSKGDYGGIVRMLKKAKSKRDKFVYGEKT